MLRNLLSWFPIALIIASCQAQKPALKAKSDVLLATDGANTTIVGDASAIKTVRSPQQYMFNSAGRGAAACIDLFDPLKPLVYFSGQRRLMVLDNTLSVQSETNLLEVGLENVALVCRSFSHHYWVFDENLNEIIRCDAFFKPVARTGNIARFYKVTSISKMKENGNLLFAMETGKGVHVFDPFANRVRFLPFPDVVSFDVFDAEVMAIDSSGRVYACTPEGFGNYRVFEKDYQGARNIGILKDFIALEVGGELLFETRILR